MVTKPAMVLRTSERIEILTDSKERLKALFVKTFSKDGEIQGNDGKTYKVSDLLNDPDLFARVTRRD